MIELFTACTVSLPALFVMATAAQTVLGEDGEPVLRGTRSFLGDAQHLLGIL